MAYKTMRLLMAAGAAAALAAAAAPASAGVTFCHANGDGPCNIVGENVHFDGDDGADNVVIGDLQSGLVDVIFTGDERITTSAQGNGVAWVVPVDGAFFTLDVSLEGGYTFRSISWRLNPPQGGRPSAWGITLYGYDVGDNPFQTSYSGILQDERFSIKATGSTRLTHIAFTTDSPIASTAQWQIGGVAAIPEPATWALMIAGFGGAGAMLRRRRTVIAA